VIEIAIADAESRALWKVVGTLAGKLPGDWALVRVVVDEESFELRRPTLLGAILIKARSLVVHRDPESQREDLLRLLSLVNDPRAIAPELRPTERKWMRRAETRLAFSEPANLDPGTVRRARQAYRLLLDPS
jgi:hypothetical protein